ncbi:MAG TPA: response regulator [Candidatus Omnitrophota bacterium]|nr:response regulator [Candidatus Omnitrophota bacterium]
MDDFERMTILLVEPHQLVRRILRDILRVLGVGKVTAVDSIEMGYRFVTDTHVDAIFTDWSGSTDAISLLRLLRAVDSPNPFVPVVVMTAFGDREHVREARDEGANEYMLKPFAPHTVASRLKAVSCHPRMFVKCPSFFGPDRRRHSWLDFAGPERRRATKYVDRRCQQAPFPGDDRRGTRAPLPPDRLVKDAFIADHHRTWGAAE